LRTRIIVSPSAANTVTVVDGYPAVRSLQEAINLAGRRQIDLIELRFDGPEEIFELPDVDSSLKIRAAKDFAPLLRLNGDSSPQKLKSMFRIARSLTLTGIDLQMLVPLNQISNRWTMFELSPTGELHINDCTITVRNTDSERRSYVPDVAVVHLGFSSSNDMLAPDTEFDRAFIEVQDCSVRAEATFLRSDVPTSVYFRWQNGLFLSTERLVNIVSANKYSEEELDIDIDLEHVTAVVDGGLAEFRDNNLSNRPAKVQIGSRYNVIRTQIWSSLITHSGSGMDRQPNRFLAYTGRGNVYQDISTFWKANALTGKSSSLNFSDWVATVDDRSLVSKLQWPMQVIDNLAVSQHTRRKYNLDSSVNPSLFMDGEMAGFTEIREFPPLEDGGPVRRLVPNGLF
jgi:hypothetical protein